MKNAIKMKCYDCCYDSEGGGKSNIRDCKDYSCSLWAYRPMARLDKYKAYKYVDFNLDNKSDIRGKWIAENLNEKEIEEIKQRSELAKIRFLAIKESAEKNEK